MHSNAKRKRIETEADGRRMSKKDLLFFESVFKSAIVDLNASKGDEREQKETQMSALIKHINQITETNEIAKQTFDKLDTTVNKINMLIPSYNSDTLASLSLNYFKTNTIYALNIALQPEHKQHQAAIQGIRFEKHNESSSSNNNNNNNKAFEMRPSQRPKKTAEKLKLNELGADKFSTINEAIIPAVRASSKVTFLNHQKTTEESNAVNRGGSSNNTNVNQKKKSFSELVLDHPVAISRSDLEENFKKDFSNEMTTSLIECLEKGFINKALCPLTIEGKELNLVLVVIAHCSRMDDFYPLDTLFTNFPVLLIAGNLDTLTREKFDTKFDNNNSVTIPRILAEYYKGIHILIKFKILFNHSDSSIQFSILQKILESFASIKSLRTDLCKNFKLATDCAKLLANFFNKNKSIFNQFNETNLTSLTLASTNKSFADYIRHNDPKLFNSRHDKKETPQQTGGKKAGTPSPTT